MAQVRQPAKGAQFLGSKHASHPINAMYSTTPMWSKRGRLARALTAAGFALTIGFLHSDKHGRNSLVWDAIEALRPLSDARVFKFIAQREFVRSDFPQAGRNAHRVDRAIIAESFCGFRCCRGSGMRTRRDGWRRRLKTPASKVSGTKSAPNPSPVSSRKSKGSADVCS